ncbi:MAG: IS1595 family transposase [Acidimicrobiia bacterium]|nr:IS1595 family transposase [Acidimicrobiia bacterium]
MTNGALDLSKLAKYFSDEDAARALLEDMRWGGNPTCPHCGGLEPYTLTPKATSKRPGRKGLYKCRACRKQFTVTVGTIFEDSHIPISKWLLALHLLASSKKGISAHQLHRNLGISYKGAWFMAMRLRHAMAQGPMGDLMMKGDVEVDETYVGGKRKGTRRGRPGPESHKTPVVALVERKSGRVRAFPMPRVTAENLKQAVYSHVQRDATLMTDDYFAYRSVGEGMAAHEVVKHTNDEYVRGNAHTNTVEGFFSLLKRGVNGVYHHVSRGHLARYCDEFAFRYENRKVSDGARAAKMVLAAEGKRLTYKQPA